MTLAAYLERAVRTWPDKTALVDFASDDSQVTRLSFSELDRRSNAIALGLRNHGMEFGDVVSVQLPNCWQFMALVLACSKIGAVINPLLPIYREHELEFMLNFCESKLLVVPASYRGRDHAAMVAAMRPGLPHLRDVVVLGDGSPRGFDRALCVDDVGSSSTQHPRPQHADDVALLMYTSGTTGQPKGVMHTSNTLMSTLEAARRVLTIDDRDVALCAAPIGHMLGLALLGILPLMAGATTVIMSAWDAPKALALARAESVTFGAGATPYLSDILQAVAGGVPWAPTWRLLCCAGAPIPPVLVERADKELGLTVCSMYGMTEVQAGAVTDFSAGNRYSAVADGKPPPGMEMRIVDERGHDVGLRETGRLLVRGCGVFAGYLKHPELNAVDADGWFDTGDLAYFVDAEGYVRLNGRSKDILKRGGIGVPVVEVEALIARHPSVAAVAIVGWPDPRLGERVCAFVSLRPGARLDLVELKAHLEAARLTPQYWPERLELCDELPRTASGKVQKFRLQALAREFPPYVETS
ncbi:MAG: AMP-binding protein [Burkholderiaceae bacterium]